MTAKYLVGETVLLQVVQRRLDLFLEMLRKAEIVFKIYLYNIVYLVTQL